MPVERVRIDKETVTDKVQVDESVRGADRRRRRPEHPRQLTSLKDAELALHRRGSAGQPFLRPASTEARQNLEPQAYSPPNESPTCIGLTAP